jgi:hypothetical protein
VENHLGAEETSLQVYEGDRVAADSPGSESLPLLFPILSTEGKDPKITLKISIK